MKNKRSIEVILIIILLVLLGYQLALATEARPAPTATPAPPQTYHWLTNAGDDAYVLCANGQFVIEVNGNDSIHLICVGD